MNQTGHWGKFSAAIADLLATSKRPGVAKPYAEFSLRAAVLLRMSQRFYLPHSKDVLLGKLIDDQIKELVRLPFDVVSVLSECTFHGGGLPEEHLWKISIAFDPDGPANKSMKMVKPPDVGFDRSDRTIAIISLIPAPPSMSSIGWLTTPVVCNLLIPGSKPGWEMWATGDASYISAYHNSPKALYSNIAKEFLDDVNSVTNLCAILNLQNVTASESRPPAKLIKKRGKLGRMPLYSYHVLDVDGERWDSPYENTGSGNGVRSHLRRGHIRRLDNRHVWVRATFVHGSVPGFADKDYKVTTVTQ